MTNKFPIGQSFQRLTDSPLDETVVFDTLAQAQDYASNNPTAYEGQMIYVKDARTYDEIVENVNIYERSCYIDSNKKIQPICSLSNKSIDILYDIIEDVLNRTTGNTKEKLDYFYELITNGYNNNVYPDYSVPVLDIPGVDGVPLEPWNPDMYNESQIVLKMTQHCLGDTIGRNTANFYIAGTDYITRNVYIRRDGKDEFYKIITCDNPPTGLNFRYGNYIEKVICICDVSNIRDMNNMFNGCSSLTELNLSNLNSTNALLMSYMFANCTSLTSLDLSNLYTSKVISMDYMFAGCESLKNLNLTGWNTINVTSFNYMFYDCKVLYLNNIDMTDCPQATVTKITNAFSLSR